MCAHTARTRTKGGPGDNTCARRVAAGVEERRSGAARAVLRAVRAARQLPAAAGSNDRPCQRSGGNRERGIQDVRVRVSWKCAQNAVKMSAGKRGGGRRGHEKNAKVGRFGVKSKGGRGCCCCSSRWRSTARSARERGEGGGGSARASDVRGEARVRPRDQRGERARRHREKATTADSCPPPSHAQARTHDAARSQKKEKRTKARALDSLFFSWPPLSRSLFTRPRASRAASARSARRAASRRRAG